MENYSVIALATLLVLAPLMGAFFTASHTTAVTGKTAANSGTQTGAGGVPIKCSLGGSDGISGFVDGIIDCADSITNAAQEGTFQAVLGVFRGIESLIANVGALLDTAGSYADSLSNSSIPGLDPIVDFLTQIGRLGGTLGSVADTFGSVTTDLVESIFGTYNKIISFILDIPEQFANYIGEVINTLNNVIFDPIIDGISGATDWIEESAESVIEFIKKAFGL